MNRYETVVIFTPILSDDETKKQVKKYADMITAEEGSMVNEDHWGLKQLAYPIQNKTTGIYHIYEYNADSEFVNKLEVSFKRDEHVLRFLTVALDKYAIDYNERKRNGLIGKKVNQKVTEEVEIVEETVVEKGADPELEKLKASE